MARRKRQIRRPEEWENLLDEQLLRIRVRDLGLQIEGSVLQSRVEQLYAELDDRGIGFHPPCYLANEWLCPDRVPMIGVPFYLVHPRLKQLEQDMMLEVEGGTESSCMKLLRHEAGHAINYAYRLFARTRWRELFGPFSAPYSESYYARPYSKLYVIHLGYNYAQAHPDEDFAETFAVWLQPRSNWRKVYQGWPAMRKLRYMDELMKEISGKKPLVTSRKRVTPLKELRKTLRQYYREKQERYATEYPDFYDADLFKLFSAAPEHHKNETAAYFLRRVRPSIRRMVSQWTGHYEYSLDQVLKDIIGRCRELKLRVAEPAEQLKIDTAIMLTVKTMDFVYSGRRWVDL